MKISTKKIIGLSLFLSTSFTVLGQTANQLTITSNQAAQGGQLNLNDPNVTTNGQNSTSWSVDNYTTNFRIYRPALSINTAIFNSSGYLGIFRYKNATTPIRSIFEIGNDVLSMHTLAFSRADLGYGYLGWGSNLHYDMSTGLWIRYAESDGTNGATATYTSRDGAYNIITFADNKAGAQSNITGAQILANRRFRVEGSGQVSISDASGNFGVLPNTTARLAVNGTIYATGVKVQSVATWSDFVFDNNYKLRSLADVEKYIEIENHLPDVPSAEEVKKDGVQLEEMDAILLRKIEEITLYLIEIKKDNEQIKAENTLLKAQISQFAK